MTASVMTVTGPVAPDTLGIAHSHEHVLWDYFRMIRSYEVIFDDETVATSEVHLFAHAGGGIRGALGAGASAESRRRAYGAVTERFTIDTQQEINSRLPTGATTLEKPNRAATTARLVKEM